MANFIRTSRTAQLVAAAVAITVACVLLVVNYMGGEKKIQQRIERLYSLEDPRFMHELGVLLGPPFLAGNRHQVLLNGDQIFPPMLAAIRSAQKSITFETYIYWSGDIGREFADALAERARHGVKVHVLLDWVGSAKVDENFVDQLTAAGVQIRKFHPPHWSHLGRLNNRTHPKPGIGNRVSTGSFAANTSSKRSPATRWKPTLPALRFSEGFMSKLSNCFCLPAAKLQKKHPCKERHKDEIICAVDTKERTGKEIH